VNKQDIETAIDAAFLTEVGRLFTVLCAALASQEEHSGRERFLKGLVNAMQTSRVAKETAAKFTDYP
jgi:hypothetical protein